MASIHFFEYTPYPCLEFSDAMTIGYIYQYADDTQLHRSFPIKWPHGLSLSLRHIHMDGWMNECLLELNTSKTELWITPATSPSITFSTLKSPPHLSPKPRLSESEWLSYPSLAMLHLSPFCSMRKIRSWLSSPDDSWYMPWCETWSSAGCSWSWSVWSAQEQHVTPWPPLATHGQLNHCFLVVSLTCTFLLELNHPGLCSFLATAFLQGTHLVLQCLHTKQSQFRSFSLATWATKCH